MATVTISGAQNINIRQIIVGAFVAMITAGAFLILMTNMIVGSRVGALEDRLAQLSAYQNNPVTVSPAAQTNTVASACVDPTVSSGSSGDTEVAVAHKKSGGWTISPSKAWMPIGGSYSNSSTITTTSTNTFIYDSYNTSSWTRNTSMNNGNTLTDNRYSGNTLTANVSWNNGNTITSNSGNTTNTDNTQNTTNNNNQAWNNGNTSNSGNSSVNAPTTNTTTTTNTSTNTTTNTDNSNSSVNTTITDNMNNNGNSTATTTNTDNSNNSVNIHDNPVTLIPVIL